ncbi:phosphodiesterase [Agrobacterium sp. LAD9]|uniref:phosphodiesterase n=1 Tax=Agrobacterium sp. LAD9 TaxID=2055153 RepID=UPI0018654DA8|nr:phosphodiesterase [Agrobacterium sp. LAD9]
MQKIIQLTDPHLVAPGNTLFGLDPAHRLRDTLAHISSEHPDSAAILITGDLTDTGEPEAYKLLQKILTDVALPVHLTLGNHDSRSAYRNVFGGHGFVQEVIDLKGWRIILLDTNDEDSDCGSLDGGRLEWLDEQLVRSVDVPVVIAMHHTPSNFHAPFFGPEDDMKDPEGFLRVIGKHKTARHMLFGHRHLTAAGSFGGVPFTASRGTAHHIALDFQQYGRSTLVAAAPSYDVIFLGDENVIVHSHHGLESYQAIRPGDPKNELYAVA